MRDWKDEYDSYLIKVVPHLKNDWKKITSKFKEAFKVKVTPFFLKNHYQEISGKIPQSKSHFSHEQDVQLATLVREHGLDWGKIAEEMRISDPVKIKNRYYSFIKKKNLKDKLCRESKKKSLQSK
mmetsp:Transcript_13183/g.11265  ORF Transcript_13183/g.11265 Transcript_13183/m.11265 type:complete len:125 (+) Transcript_13183:512-886(+)